MGAFMVPMEPPQESSSVQNLRAQYEWQIHAKDQKLRDLQNRLSREEHDRVQMQQDFERDRHGLVRHLNQLVNAVERYGIQVETPQLQNVRVSSLEGWMSASQESSLVRQGGGLDGKMEQLSGLLREGPGSGDTVAPARWDQQTAPGPIGSIPKGPSSLGIMHGSAARQDEVLSRPSGRNTSACGTPGSNTGGIDSKRGGGNYQGDLAMSGGSRQRVMFPHDIAPGQDPLARNMQTAAAAHGPGAKSRDDGFRGVLERSIRTLERRFGDSLDDQARSAMESLSPQGIREVVKRAQDAFQESGQHQELSRLVQSLCRKIRRSENGDSKPSRHHPGSSEDGTETGVPRSALRSDKQLGNAVQLEDSRSHKRATVSSTAAPNASPNPRRAVEPWSAARLDRLCKQGGFGLKQVGDEAWVMKLQMCDLEPPLGDEGMQVFCRWLHQRVQRIKESKDIRSMRHVRTEVSFARNNLGDAAIGRLLTALQRTDLHVATLNLLGNCIGLAGLRHVTDFLHEATCPVYEVHLGHNDIDDDAAMELVRATAEHPRYAAARRGNEQLVQIWLRLNSNPIRDPGKLLWKLESQFGANISSVRNRQAATRCQAPVLISVEDSSHWVQDSHEKEQWSRNHDRGREKHTSETSWYGQRRYDAPPNSARRETGVSSSAAEGNYRSTGQHQSRSYAVASKPSVAASSSGGGKQVISLPASGISSAIRKSADDTSQPNLMRPADGVVRLQSELSGLAQASQETQEVPADAEAENRSENEGGEQEGGTAEIETRSSTSSVAPLAEIAVDNMDVLEEDVEEETAEVEDIPDTEVSEGASAPRGPSTPLRGPPEETPEPDSVKKEAMARLALDEDDESPPPVQPVKLLVPPRILQRST